jgi:hypothetical protein
MNLENSLYSNRALLINTVTAYGKSEDASPNPKSSYEDLDMDTSENITNFKPACKLKRDGKSK